MSNWPHPVGVLALLFSVWLVFMALGAMVIASTAAVVAFLRLVGAA